MRFAVPSPIAEDPNKKGSTMKTLYTAEALATGDGRNGHGRTTDGKVDEIGRAHV